MSNQNIAFKSSVLDIRSSIFYGNMKAFHSNTWISVSINNTAFIGNGISCSTRNYPFYLIMENVLFLHSKMQSINLIINSQSNIFMSNLTFRNISDQSVISTTCPECKYHSIKATFSMKNILFTDCHSDHLIAVKGTKINFEDIVMKNNTLDAKIAKQVPLQNGGGCMKFNDVEGTFNSIKIYHNKFISLSVYYRKFAIWFINNSNVSIDATDVTENEIIGEIMVCNGGKCSIANSTFTGNNIIGFQAFACYSICSLSNSNINRNA